MTCAEPLLGVGCYGNCLYSTCRRDILLDRTDGSRVDDWGKEILGGAWLMGNMGLGKLSSSSHKVFFFSFFLSVFPSSFFILEQPVSFVGLIFITGSNEGCGMNECFKAVNAALRSLLPDLQQWIPTFSQLTCNCMPLHEPPIYRHSTYSLNPTITISVIKNKDIPQI